MEETVTLFVYQSDKCAQLVKDLYEVLRSSGKAARIRVIRAKISNPAEFPAFLDYLEELYGSQYVSEYRKYSVEKLPALIIGDTKIFEGYFPSKGELAELIGAPPKPAQPKPVEPQRAPPPALRGGCRGCVFFDEAGFKCVLLRTKVEDPGAPPCKRRS